MVNGRKCKRRRGSHHVLINSKAVKSSARLSERDPPTLLSSPFRFVANEPRPGVVKSRRALPGPKVPADFTDPEWRYLSLDVNANVLLLLLVLETTLHPGLEWYTPASNHEARGSTDGRCPSPASSS
jgi:hypothetical protein